MWCGSYSKQDAEPYYGGSKLQNNTSSIPLEDRVKILEDKVKQLLDILSKN